MRIRCWRSPGYAQSFLCLLALAALAAAGAADAAPVAGVDAAPEEPTYLQETGNFGAEQEGVGVDQHPAPHVSSDDGTAGAVSGGDASSSLHKEVDEALALPTELIGPPHRGIRGIKTSVLTGIALALSFLGYFSALGLYVIIVNLVLMPILFVGLIEIFASLYERRKARESFSRAKELLQYVPKGLTRQTIKKNLQRPVPPQRPLFTKFFFIQLAVALTAFVLIPGFILTGMHKTMKLNRYAVAAIVLPLGTVWAYICYLARVALWKLKQLFRRRKTT